MIVIGCLFWVVVAAAYYGLFGGLLVLLVRRAAARGWSSAWHLQAGAALGAFLLAPCGALALYLPVHSGGTLVKPRLVESLSVAYLAPLAAGLLFGAAAAYLLARARRPPRDT